jgi:predicted enzyme related to lactoylglutathione lyase
MSTARVVGIGGIFFKARDPKALGAWYRDHLGLAITEWGGVTFEPAMTSPAGRESTLAWSIFPATTDYFGSGGAQFMINYRVDDLDQVLAALRAEGCPVDERVDSSEFGRFGWVTDPEGNRVELWEPPRVTPGPA